MKSLKFNITISTFFYLTYFIIGFFNYRLYINANPNRFNPPFPLSFFIPSFSFKFWIIIFFIIWLIATLLFFLQEAKIQRLLIAVSSLGLYLISNSFGKENHPMAAITAIAVILSLTDLQKIYFNQRQIWTWAQIYLLSVYESAGLWKLRSFVAAGGFQDLKNILLGQIAYSVGEGNGPHFIFSDIQSWSFLLVPGFFAVLCFQLLSFVPVLFKRWLPLWGVMAILFHILTGLTMNIWFLGQILADFFALVLVPVYNNTKKHNVNSAVEIKAK